MLCIPMIEMMHWYFYGYNDTSKAWQKFKWLTRDVQLKNIVIAVDADMLAFLLLMWLQSIKGQC